MKRIVFIPLILLLFVSQYSFAQNVNIPDAGFLNALIAQGVDTSNDSLIQSSEAAAVKSLNVSFGGINDLAGIEAFVNLDTLDCSSNQITALDLSQNTKLVFLNSSINKLTTLDLSGNALLKSLSCSNNKLTNLNVSGCTELMLLDCGFNKLPDLDLSANANLEVLECYSNLLDTLELSHNVNLTSLYCGNNQIKSLDLSASKALKLVDCQFNKLSDIDLTKNAVMTDFACYSNLLTSLDLKNNPFLKRLDIGGNLYTTLDLSKIDSLHSLDCAQNPNLTYICVKDTALVSSNFYFYKDATAQWTEDCDLTTGVMDGYHLVNVLQLSPNPSKAYFNLSLPELASVRIFNALGIEIEAFDLIQNLQFGQDYGSGLYYVAIAHDGNKSSREVVKIVKE